MKWIPTSKPMLRIRKRFPSDVISSYRMTDGGLSGRRPLHHVRMVFRNLDPLSDPHPHPSCVYLFSTPYPSRFFLWILLEGKGGKRKEEERGREKREGEGRGERENHDRRKDGIKMDEEGGTRRINLEDAIKEENETRGGEGRRKRKEGS